MRSVFLLALLIGSPLLGDPPAGIEGRVVDTRGEGIGGVTVTLDPSGSRRVTDSEGRYTFESILPGTYRLALRLGEKTAAAAAEVKAGGSTAVETTVDWLVSFTETLTVTAASRQDEGIVAAPAAVTLVTGEEAARQPSHGQLPRLLAFSPGVELVQSGLYDFNLNTHGFNAAVNQRLLTLIDGRDPSLPGIGSQRWASVSFPMDEVRQLELVRGPGSALYGAGAYNGVFDVRTKEPRANLGGAMRLTAGDLDTRRLELRYAGELGRESYFRLLGGYQEGGDFFRSRVESVEYQPGRLPQEVIAPPRDDVRVAFGGLRLDKYLGPRDFTLEVGTSEHAGEITVAHVGRSQVQHEANPWGRFRFASPHWYLQASYTGQVAEDIRSLSSGAPLYLDSSRAALDLQANTSFADGRGRLLGGLSGSRESMDSADPQGQQTIFSEPQSADHQGVYGQVDYSLTPRLKGVLALRWDDSDLHDPELSPRAALVYSLSPQHTLRLSYNRGFQSPPFVQTFLRSPVAPPLDLAALEQALAPVLQGVTLGFGSIPILAVGNADSNPERVAGLELGYSGILSRDLFVTVDLYRNELKDFVTNLLPQVGTSLGRLNQRFGPYRPPATLSPQAAAAVLAALQAALPPNLFASLSNDADGSPALVLLSVTNSGRVQTKGADLALSYIWRQNWWMDLSYSYFGFEIKEQASENLLVPNTPRNRFALGVSYAGEPWSGSLRYRWTESFDWASGIFVGPVPSYGVADLSLNYRIRQGWAIGLDVANLFDKEHYEMFGGDLLRRRALAYVAWSW